MKNILFSLSSSISIRYKSILFLINLTEVNYLWKAPNRLQIVHFGYPKISIRNMIWIRQMWSGHSRRGHCSLGTVRRYSSLCQLGNSLWSSESPLLCSKFCCHLYHISWRDPAWRPYKMTILSIMLKVFFPYFLKFLFLYQFYWGKISISSA